MEQDITQDFGIVTLPLDTKRFEANGVWYNVTDKIATGRMSSYEKLTTTFGFGFTPDGLSKWFAEHWELVDKMKFAELSVHTYNAMDGFANLQSNRVRALDVCTLFINADGEDARFIDETLMRKKISDWEQAGIDRDFFLTLAIASSVGYRSAYERLFPITSKPGPVQES